MFENVGFGMVMCDFAVLFGYVDPRTLAPRGGPWGNQASSFAGGFRVFVRTMFLWSMNRMLWKSVKAEASSGSWASEVLIQLLMPKAHAASSRFTTMCVS